jgi:hypothetical protein
MRDVVHGYMRADSPIIILSSERSGSNLLRSLFSNHSQVDGPVSPQFTDPFLKNLHRYGRIENRLNAVRLIEDMLLYSKHRYSAWDIESTGEAIYEKYQPRSFFGVLFALYSEKSLANGKITFFL